MKPLSSASLHPQEPLLLVGVLGTGMRALASLALKRGWTVYGSDAGAFWNRSGSEKEASRDSFARGLLKKGLKSVEAYCRLEDLLEQEQLSRLTVVYSTAIAPSHPQRSSTTEGVTFLHRAQLLAHFTGDDHLLGVMGTHGKTSTSALLVALLQDLEPGYYVGESFCLQKERALWSSNGAGKQTSLCGGSRSSKSDFEGAPKLFITEMDESDGSFTYMRPQALILTNFDGDHLEQWSAQAAHKLELAPAQAPLRKQFGPDAKKNQEQTLIDYLERVRPHLYYNIDCPHARSLAGKLTLPSIRSYGFSPQADYVCKRPCSSSEQRVWAAATAPKREELVPYETFALTKSPQEDLIGTAFKLGALLGAHQVLNATAALAVEVELRSRLEEKKLVAPSSSTSSRRRQLHLKQFGGILRRMRPLWQFVEPSLQNCFALFDDYAHHPLEARLTLEGFASSPLGQRFKKLYVVFEPHRRARFQASLEDFAVSLDLADRLYLLDLFEPSSSSSAFALEDKALVRSFGHLVEQRAASADRLDVRQEVLEENAPHSSRPRVTPAREPFHVHYLGSFSQALTTLREHFCLSRTTEQCSTAWIFLGAGHASALACEAAKLFEQVANEGR